MKIAGIILLILGVLSTLGGIMAISNGHNGSFAGLTFVALGGYLIYRANQKKEEEEKKKQWAEKKENDN